MSDDTDGKPTRRIEPRGSGPLVGTTYSITRPGPKVEVSVRTAGNSLEVHVGAQRLQLSKAEGRRLLAALLETLG